MNDDTLQDDAGLGRFWYLIDAAVAGTLADGETAELEKLLTGDLHLRQMYLEYTRLHYELTLEHGAQAAVEAVRGQGSGVRDQGSGARGQSQKGGRTLRLTLALALSLLILAGLAGLMFLGLGNNRPAVVEAPATAEAVAKLVGATEAQWDPAFAPTGNDLTAAQRLKLQSGTAEIAFATGARVVLEGPADFTLAPDAKHTAIHNPQSTIHNSCYLALGKLTANVPQSAKGFTVETPIGRATDLGTQFGVLVRSEVGSRKSDSSEPTSDLRLPTSTEVHVFQGRVDVTEADQVANATPSTIHHPPSTILTSGQAVAMSLTGLERLPAADPFRFRTEAFDGSRQVLIAEDFESMPLGASGRVLGDWRAEYADNQYQQIITVDPSIPSPPGRQGETDTGSLGSPSVLPPVGQRAMEFTSTAKVVKHLYPILTREVDGGKFPARSKLLVECDILPRTQVVEPSLALNSDYPLRLAPGIALSREADPAAAKIEWRKDQWYRVRVVWDMEDGAPRGATVERLEWRGADGWVRDVSVQLPAPKVPTGMLAQVRFGFPAPIVGKVGGTYWLDNVRMEVIAEK
jgi:hypothetical protein